MLKIGQSAAKVIIYNNKVQRLFRKEVEYFIYSKWETLYNREDIVSSILKNIVKVMVDGLMIRSLLMSFFYKIFPEIIEDGRLYIAEPPLYRINDKKDPFVINKKDYVNRYIKNVIKEYDVGNYIDNPNNPEWFNKKELFNFLEDTAQYVNNIKSISKHYDINETLCEILYSYIANLNINPNNKKETIKNINIQDLMIKINEQFPELFYDDKNDVIRGVIDGRYQLIEITPSFIYRGNDVINTLQKIINNYNGNIAIRNKKTGTIYHDGLLNILKIIHKYQPTIAHRFKG